MLKNKKYDKFKFTPREMHGLWLKGNVFSDYIPKVATITALIV
jgi:hypothetical protein